MVTAVTVTRTAQGLMAATQVTIKVNAVGVSIDVTTVSAWPKTRCATTCTIAVCRVGIPIAEIGPMRTTANNLDLDTIILNRAI